MEEKKGCMDVTLQALKGEVMPLRWCPRNDFTSTVALLDPDTPTRPSQQILVPIGPMRTAGMEIWTERTETERENRRERGVVLGQGRYHEKGAMQKVNCWSEVFIGMQKGGNISGSLRWRPPSEILTARRRI